MFFLKIKNNIEKFYQERISGLDLKDSEDRIIESFENYLRTKFLDFKNDSQIDKKFKSYKKDLNDKFKDRIVQLNEATLDQGKFNSLISELISHMNLDENLDEEEKKDEDQNNDDKENKPDSQDKQAKEKDDKQEEMSIDSGMPDLENEAKESNQTEEDVEIETILPFGESSEADSPHFTDQMEMYLNQERKTMTLDKTKVYEQAVKVYHPKLQ